MNLKETTTLPEFVDIISRFFKQLHDTCEKFKTDIEGGKTDIDVKKPAKKKAVDPLKSDPSAPKRPIMQGYLLYYSEIRAKKQKENPDVPNKELTKLIAEDWNKLSKEKKKHYEEKAKSNKKEYDENLEKYLTKNPAMREAIGQSKKKKKSSESEEKPKPASNGKGKKPAPKVEEEEDEEDEEDSEEEEEKPKPKPKAKKVLSSSGSSDSESEDSEVEEAPKKKKK